EREFLRGVGLLVRVDLAIAALLVAIIYSMVVHGAGGWLAAKGVLFCLALAMGPAQSVFLLPAAIIGAQSQQPRATRGMLQSSIPVFAVSVLCAVWLA